MDKPRGGRGRTAPYETKQMRVPVGLETQIQDLISRYRGWISKAGTSTVGANNPPLLLDKSLDISSIEPVDKLKGEIARLNKLVDSLREEMQALTSERDSLDKEVNQLHAKDGDQNLEIAELKEQLKAVDKLNGVSSSGNKPVDSFNRLVIISENKPVDNLNDSKLVSMTQRQLAKHLNTSHTSVSRHQKKEDFIIWSRNLDPDQVGWRYDSTSKLFYPQQGLGKVDDLLSEGEGSG